MVALMVPPLAPPTHQAFWIALICYDPEPPFVTISPSRMEEPHTGLLPASPVPELRQ